MRQKVIITGATGFVGSNLTRYLSEKGYEVHIIVRQNSDLKKISSVLKAVSVFEYNNSIEDLISFFKEIKPTAVFHLASNFIAEHQSNQIDGLIESNLKFGLHILEAMKEAGVKNLINTGTSWQHYENEDYNPVCLYAATKEAFENLIEYYVQAHQFSAITLKLFDTYGENDNRPKLINLLNKFADEKTELNMSPGDQMLNLVHIEDVCLAYEEAFKQLNVMKKGCHYRYVTKNKESHRLKDVISIFEKISGKTIAVNWGGRPYRQREVMTVWEKGANLPNWTAKIKLEEGLKRYRDE